MAVGSVDQVFSTTDGGSTWNEAQYLPAGSGPDYDAVSCISANTCWVGNTGARIIETTDGGASWVDRSPSPGSVQAIRSIECLNADDCFAATYQTTGGSPIDEIIYTTDGGIHWTIVNEPVFGFLDCVSVSTCWLAGQEGTHPAIAVTTDAGHTWTVQSTFPSLPTWGQSGGGFSGISCPDAEHCVAVGGYQYGSNTHEVIVASTANAGSTWTLENAPNGVTALTGISCGSQQLCFATAPDSGTIGGTIVMTSDAGKTWVTAYRTSGSVDAISCAGPSNFWAVGSGPSRGDNEGTSYIATTFSG